jgi:hypothetical protein
MQNQINRKPGIKRREFFRSLVRNSIFASMLGGSALLLMKKNANEGDCTFDFICQNCKKNHFCQLPEASLFRLKKRKENEKRG